MRARIEPHPKSVLEDAGRVVAETRRFLQEIEKSHGLTREHCRKARRRLAARRAVGSGARGAATGGGGLFGEHIAERLNLSVKTVESHRLHLREKLGLAKSAEL